MELLEAIRIIRKQLKVVIPLLILAFIIALAMVMRIETTYQSSGNITLLNSNLESTDNPYLSFDQSLQTTAQVLGDTVSTNDARKAFEDKGLSPDYEVGVPYDPTRTVLLPMLEVTATANSEEAAIATRDELLVNIKDELAKKQTQAGAPADTWIQAFSTADREVIPVSGSKSRTFIIVFGLGVAFAFTVAFIIDGFKRGVRNTRRGETILLEADQQLKGNSATSETVKAPLRKTRTRNRVRKTKPENTSSTKDNSQDTASI